MAWFRLVKDEKVYQNGVKNHAAPSSPSKKPSLVFSTIGWPKQLSANVTNSFFLSCIRMAWRSLSRGSFRRGIWLIRRKFSKPAEFGGTSLCRTQSV